METNQILKAAREIVGSVKTALAITVDPAGIAKARGVWTGPLEPDWRRGSNQGNTQNEKSLYHQSSIDFRCYPEVALFEPRLIAPI